MADVRADGGSNRPDEPRSLAARLYAALSAGDREELLSLLHPEFEGRLTAGLPGGLGGTFRGAAAMRRGWGRIGRLFDARAVPRAWTDLPDGRLLVEGDYTGSARHGGRLDAAFVHLLSFDGGRISALEQLTDSARWAAALAGAGEPDPPGAGQDNAGQDSTGQPDAGLDSIGQPDAGLNSTGQPDAGLNSTGQPDAGLDSTGQSDAGAAGQSGPRLAGDRDRRPVTAGERDGQRRRTVTLAVEDGLAVLRLQRPGDRNAINAALVADLAEATQQCAADPAVRALLICASGPAFSVGGDIGMFAACGPGQLPGDLRRLTTSYHAALQILDQLPVPVIAAVHGTVAGGALGLLYVADIVLAAEGTRFATGFAGIGLSGDGGGSWFLPRLIGPRRAAEMYLGQRVLTADEALDWGLITGIRPAGELEAEAFRLARGLAAGPTTAFGELRGLLRRAPDASLAGQLRAETEALARTAASEDARTGIAAFLARNRPQFRGR